MLRSVALQGLKDSELRCKTHFTLNLKSKNRSSVEKYSSVAGSAFSRPKHAKDAAKL